MDIPEETTPFWKELVAHIDTTWKKKKSVGFYFRSRVFRELKELARIYQPWGVMALWDLYLADTSDEFVVRAGHSFEMFCQKIPKLLDMGWKGAARRYEEMLCGPYPNVIDTFANKIAENQTGPTSNASDEGPAETEERGYQTS